MQSKKDLVKYSHKVYKRNYVSATDGNLSIRTKNNTILITRSSICKGDVQLNDILEIDFDGNILKGKGKISTEHKLHIYIYKKRKDINAVVHCHPIFSTAFAIANYDIDKPILPEVILSIGRIPICKYATPSTEELPNSLENYINFANVFLLQNHGAVAIGENIQQAYFRMEKLEHTAQIYFNSIMLGKLSELPKDKLNELYSIVEKTYGINLNYKNKYI